MSSEQHLPAWLDKDGARDEETVSEEVRKEHIDTDGRDDTRR